MSGNRLHQILIRAARSESIDSGVPEGFEERVMRAVRAVRIDDPLDSWASGLGRAALSSAGFAAGVGLIAIILAFTDDGSIGPSWGVGFRSDHWPGAGDEIARVLIDDLESGDLR